MSTEPRVLISYARSDGAEYAAGLRNRLQSEHPAITVRQDVISERAGRDWWLQITEALDHVEYMVLVMTPAAMQAENVRKEWRYARQKGVCVIPVQGAPHLDFAILPRWMRDKHYTDLSVPEQWVLFVADLTAPCQTPRVPFMVEDLPGDFVPRPAEFHRLISLLRDEKREEPVAITAALQGAGGYGKTTMARALCHDHRIQEAFDDGILWVTLGENPGDLKLKVLDLIEVLSGTRPGFGTLEAAGSRLAELLADRDILLVIDDVWNSVHAAPFLQGGKLRQHGVYQLDLRCARLITTRNLETLPTDTQKVSVDAMRQGEAVQLLGAGLPGGHESELRRLAARLGEWPLLLRLANGVLRERTDPEGLKRPLAEALAFANEDLDENGLTAFDANDPVARDQAVAATVAVSLNQLGADQPRFEELAIFPEDTTIPLATVEQLWQARAQLSRVNAEKLCQRLHRLSLLLQFDLTTRTIRLHDVMRTYLASKLADPATVHARLVDAWGDPHKLPDGFAWRWIAYHVMGAGREEELRKLLLDFNWLQAKLNATDVTALTSDYDHLAPPASGAGAPSASLWQLVQGAVRLSAHVLGYDKNQLAAQLTGRLLAEGSPDIQAMLRQARDWKEYSWLRPLWTTLHPPGTALVGNLAGHSGPVQAVAVSADGRLAVSASHDGTLKVWDLETGRELQTLAGHSGSVNGVAVSTDRRRAVSASDDKTLKVWDLETGRELCTLVGHSASVRGVAVSADGRRAVSASRDQTLKVWDLESGRELHTLAGHSKRVYGVAVSADGRWAVSASGDQTLKVWDVESGRELRTLAGHSGLVTSVALSADGRRAVSASRDRTLKVWDLETGRELHTLAGHSGQVLGVAVSADGRRAVSAGRDSTLKVWDLQTGQELRTLAGHSGNVKGVAVSADGRRAVSASADQTVKMWDLEAGRGLRTLARHLHCVNGLAVTADGRWAVSASRDKTLKVWDLETGREVRTLSGHSARVHGVAVSADGRLAVSASRDGTLKVWDLETGRELQTLAGHSGSVNGVAVSTDGRRAVSASDDKTLKVWDLETGRELRTLAGHSGPIYGVALSADGRRAVSASRDQTLKVWGLESGRELRTLAGHSGPIYGVALSADGRWAVSASGDKALKVWDVESGRELRTLAGHSGSVNGVALSADGRRAVSASRDHTVNVWDLETGALVATFACDATTRCCAFAGDRRIVAGDWSGRVHFLALELKEEN